MRLAYGVLKSWLAVMPASGGSGGGPACTVDVDESQPRASVGLWLRWEGIVYDVDVPTADKQASKKRILHGLSGQVLPGALVAAMGPSGSGKTSLMRILAARRQPSSGVVLADGQGVDLASFRRLSGFVSQTTVFLDTLTVAETLRFVALLRLDRSIPRHTKLARVDEMLSIVDLTKCAHSRIGNDVSGGISGGERRRLSIAVETVHTPRLLLLDEPTSGLDATSAQRVGDVLRRMSLVHNTSCLCTIHQPRASLLALFDTLLLLAEGRTAYFGPMSGPDGATMDIAAPTGVLAYFHSNGFTCPALENPADWLLDLVHKPDGASGDEQADSGAVAAARAAAAQHFSDLYLASPVAAAAMAPPPESQLVAIQRARQRSASSKAPRFPVPWATQFRVLWTRTLLYKLREPASIITQASTAIVMPLLIGGVYWHIPRSQAGLADRLAGASFIVLMQSFMAQDQILLFPKERSVYLRDHASGLHSTSAFFVARCCAEMPFIFAFGALCSTIVYWMYGFRASAGHFVTFLAAVVAVTEAGAALLTCIGAISPTMEVGNLLSVLIVILLTLVDGFYRNLSDLPAFISWLQVFSFQSYGVKAIAANEFRGLTFTCTPAEAAVGCILTGDAYLERLGMANVNIWANVGYMVVLAAGWRLCAYAGLHFLYTGQSFGERWRQP